MPYDLDRFLTAQQTAFSIALAELEAGEKRSHWMWFIFPQLRGLGRSATAEFYGIESLDEAKAYLAHPVLGQRLQQSTSAVLGHTGRSLEAIFGFPDHLKFCSSMTLFASAANGVSNAYQTAVEQLCGGPDARTVSLLRGSTRS